MISHSKKLRIAFLLERFPCLTETFILSQIVYLIKQGHAVDIYAEEKFGSKVQPEVISYDLSKRTKYFYKKNSQYGRLKEALQTFIKSPDKLLLLKTLNFLKYGKDSFSFKALLKAELFSKAPRYDVIHAHFGMMGKDAAMLKSLGLLKNTPLVTTFHGYDINPVEINENRKIYKELFKVADLITANSNFTAELVKQADCPEEKLVKLPVSLDTTYFKKSTQVLKSDNFTNVIFCGRLLEFKAPELIPEIADIIINKRGYKNIRFHIIGKGPLKPLVQDRIKKYKLTEYVFLHGAKTQDEIMTMMSGMDIFLYPGINDKASGRVENQGLVLQEAQSMELAVVTSNVGGIAEGVIDGKTAFVLDEGDIKGFADKVELLMLDPQLRQKMGQQGREFVVENFDSQILGKRLEEHYYSLMSDETVVVKEVRRNYLEKNL